MAKVVDCGKGKRTYTWLLCLVVNHHPRSAQVWHVFSRYLTL